MSSNPRPQTRKGAKPLPQKASVEQRAPKAQNVPNPPRNDSIYGRLQRMIPKGAFSVAGGAIGSALGGPPGAVIGKFGGDLLSRITGMGAYSIRSNSITADSGQIPSFVSGGDGVTICHREFISDITGSSSFVNAQLPINPGQASTFPWLSLVAQQFEEYQVLGMVFEYRPSSGSYAGTSSSAALGIVVFATQYNVNQPAFTTKQQIESYEYSSSTVPFTTMIHGVECAPHTEVIPTLLVRPSALPTGGTLELYDHGTFNYSTSGMPSAYVVGELWVSYHIRFMKPRMNLYAPAAQSYIHLVSSPVDTCASANLFGTTGLQFQSGFISNIITPAGTNSFYLPTPGMYWITCIIQDSGALTSSPAYNLGSGITAQTRLIKNTTIIFAATNAAGGSSSTCGVFNVTTSGVGSANLVTLSPGAGIDTGNLDLVVCYLGPVITF